MKKSIKLNNKKFTILFFVFFYLQITQAHVGFIATKKINKIEIISNTSFCTEKSYKSFVLGEYISILSKKLNFKGRVCFTFHERMPDIDSTDFYFNKNKNTIFVSFYKYDYKIDNSLNLFEYLIQNPNNRIISQEDIKRIYNSENSVLVNEILSIRQYRPKEANSLRNNISISYYYLNKQYHFLRKENHNFVVFYKIENFLDFDTNGKDLVIFSKDNQIVYFNRINKNENKTLLIEDYDLPYRPYKIHRISNELILFEFFSFMYKERILCYFINEDVLIQDLKGNVSNLVIPQNHR